MPRRPLRDVLLAGDIGGTHARLRLYDLAARRTLEEVVLPSGSAPSVEALLAPYLEKKRAHVCAAVLGIAGPVLNGRTRTTNLPWVVDERRLARELGIPCVRLVNDMTAIAVGCAKLPRSSLDVLHAGSARATGNRAVIAAGTGLGEALLVWDGHDHVPCASEGGHADFAPRTALECDLLAYLRHRTPGGHVSYERLVSGPGLGNVYDYLLTTTGETEPPAVRRKLASHDRNAAIAMLGLSGESRVAAIALELFATLFGAETGNLALKGLAIGGAFVVGRIAKEIVPRHRDAFLRALVDKGRMRPLLQRVPVAIVLDDKVGLVGAGHLAARLAAM